MTVFFSVLTILAAATAGLAREIRWAGGALWVCGLCLGCLFLAEGHEYLAVIQWLVSTLVAVVFVFYSVFFGEAPRGTERKVKDWVYPLLPALLVGAGFVLGAVLILGGDWSLVHEAQKNIHGVKEIGEKFLAKENLLLLFCVGLLLLVGVVGAGSISRPEEISEDQC